MQWSHISIWSVFGAVASTSHHSFWSMHPGKVSWYSMISCLAIASIHRIPSSWRSFKPKWLSRYVEPGTTHVWSCGVAITRYCKAFNHGDGIGAPTPMTTRRYSNKPYPKSSRNKAHIYLTSRVPLSTGWATQDLKRAEIYITGVCGQRVHYSRHSKLRLGLSIASLARREYRYGRQYRILQIVIIDHIRALNSKPMSATIANSTHWPNTLNIMPTSLKTSNMKYI